MDTERNSLGGTCAILQGVAYFVFGVAYALTPPIQIPGESRPRCRILGVLSPGPCITDCLAGCHDFGLLIRSRSRARHFAPNPERPFFVGWLDEPNRVARIRRRCPHRPSWPFSGA